MSFDRSRVGAPGFLRELQQAVWSINPNVPLGNVRTLTRFRPIRWPRRRSPWSCWPSRRASHSCSHLVGVYGVVSYIAAERTYEVGIRMALGAQSGDVRALFLRHGLALTLAGLVLGIGAAMLVTPIMSALLYGVAPTDPVTYAGVAIVLGAVTLLATYLPARRASRVEPIIALRSQWGPWYRRPLTIRLPSVRRCSAACSRIVTAWARFTSFVAVPGVDRQLVSRGDLDVRPLQARPGGRRPRGPSRGSGENSDRRPRRPRRP